MLEAVEKLLALQDRDQKIRNFRLELEAVPTEKAAKERLIASAAERLEASKSRAKEIEVAKKSLQGEAAAKREQIARYRTQQGQTRKNEEFTALSHEIDAAERHIANLEDTELELMEEADRLKPAIAQAEAEFKTEKEKVETQLTALAARETNLRARIDELVAEREKFTVGIDEDLLDRYQRLFKTKGGNAIVSLDHEVCTGCHMKVTTQTAFAVKGEKEMVGCPQCGRILFLPA